MFRTRRANDCTRRTRERPTSLLSSLLSSPSSSTFEPLYATPSSQAHKKEISTWRLLQSGKSTKNARTTSYPQALKKEIKQQQEVVLKRAFDQQCVPRRSSLVVCWTHTHTHTHTKRRVVSLPSPRSSFLVPLRRRLVVRPRAAVVRSLVDPSRAKSGP